MSRPGGYGATQEYRDDPRSSREYRDNPFDFGSRPTASRGYQGHATTDQSSFNELCDNISTNIFRINNNASSLARASKQIGTSRDSVQLRDRLHDTEQDTNRVISITAQAFRQLSSVCQRSERPQKLQYERLKNEFQETVQRYNTLQKKVAETVKSTVALGSQKSQPQQDLIGWGDDTSNDQQQLINDQRFDQLQAQQEVIDTDLALIQEREERIRQLEGDILDINEIFRDLGTLVHEQGETIDTIEANVEQAYNRVEQGTDQLAQASRYQKKARKKMCILAIILTVVAAVIVLIVVLSVKL